MKQNSKNKFYSIIIVLFSLPLTTIGQSYKALDVRVEKDGKELSLATIGGLIAPQFSSIDLNQDGVMDLFVFDRVGNIVRTFLHDGEVGSTKFSHAPQYESAFPKLTEFALLRDYNQDGKMDIFTLSSLGVNGIEIWTNTSTGDDLSFELLKNEGKPFDILYYTQSGGSEAPLYSSNIDVPAIEDIDGDGDLDILTFGQSENKVQFFKNYASEQGSRPNNHFVYKRESSCYGLMYESAFSQKVFLSSDGVECAKEEARAPLHAGSTITVLDANRDGAIDLLLGDLTSPGIVYLQNGRTTQDAWMTSQDASFPSYDVPINIAYFPSTFYLDVNNDGKKDLIACPNNNLSSENVNHIWLYINEGVLQDSFVRKQKDFLIGESLSYGTVSDFAFLDYNGDGLLDILMGTDAVIQNQTKSNALILLQNIGSAETPSYKVADEDFLNMSTLGNNNQRLSPAVGDLDGDGDDDILIGNSEGILYYFENTATAGKPMNLAPYKYTFMNIDPGLWAKPMIYDLNKDGLGDILCGEKNDNADDGVLGSVNYYENIGSKGNPKFDPDVKAGNNTSALGGIFTKDPGITSTGSASPYMISTKEGTRAVVGSRSGKIRLYGGIDADIYGIYDKLLDSLPLPLQGDMATVALADIDGDTYYEMIVGNLRGGMAFYDTPISMDSTDATMDAQRADVKLMPNPVENYLYIDMGESRLQGAEIYSVQGIVLSKVLNPKVDVSYLKKGVYFVRISDTKGYSQTLRFVKL